MRFPQGPKMRLAILTFVVLTLSFSQVSRADVTVLSTAQWTAASGGNDRWYSLVEFNVGQVTWETAKTTAEGLTLNNRFGHLATFTSEAEWFFARNSILEPFRREFDQAWLGASDQTLEGSWEWVTGEQFTYSAPAVFDDLNNEDFLMAWRFLPADPLQWNDVNSTTSLSNRALVEFGGSAVPEPTTLVLLSLSSIGIFAISRRRDKKS
jgi:hypothetical protein